ncbi:hypothetical protein [Pontibacter mangrovi]|uniref:Uncharacterized protein n=1 Tax=Pontibacter mangrovi TaxID=2589816 RepID=A0A501W4D8_9BACT|nr:hypothetical protein [Pontibacter mangrovi]TPE44449.1 hypothetical protein FJM65_09915 [Pontibacter mangrovi]
MITQNKRLTGILLAVATLLLIPFIGTLVSTEVNWGIFDFIVAGILLLGTGLMVEFVLRKVRKPEYRIAFIAAILLILFLVWAELAVGLFGTPFAGS